MTDEQNKFEAIPKIIDGEKYTIEKTFLTTLKKGDTHRGFGFYEFKDKYGKKCSLQDSSLATEPAIWFGIDDAKPQILEKGKGWVDYPISEDVMLHTRMHLTQEQVKTLLPILTYFAETGEYIRDYEGEV